jgi:outer membrane scaffolding protein for murein synthesis (MipA/OmpV family)
MATPGLKLPGLILTAGLAFAGAPAQAQAAPEKPLWEAGLGIAAFTLPAYRGSDQTSELVLPAPYFVYRGEFLKADRNGVRARLFESDRVDLTVSATLSPPASSKDIVARAGMPDLKASAEIGPRLDITLWRNEALTRQLRLELPLRAAYTLGGGMQNIGWVSHPRLNLDMTALPGFAGWNVGLQAGPLFGDSRQHQYYYGVDAAYATSTRPAYTASAGFAGMQYLVGVSKRFPKYWVGAFMRYDNLNGASFVNSPLVRTRNYFAAGVAMSWILGESSERVPADE